LLLENAKDPSPKISKHQHLGDFPIRQNNKNFQTGIWDAPAMNPAISNKGLGMNASRRIVQD